jgi:hypothetical protein
MFRISPRWFCRLINGWMQRGFMKEATFTNRSKPVQLIPPGALVLLLLAGCVTEIAAPGSDTVRITRVAGDVAGCTAVGNVNAHLGTDEKGPIVGDQVKFRNQVIGFGGNVGFVTLDGTYTTPAEGVAYRCPASP